MRTGAQKFAPIPLAKDGDGYQIVYPHCALKHCAANCPTFALQCSACAGVPSRTRGRIDRTPRPYDTIPSPTRGIGTTLVEAIHLRRNALGVELERRWANLATANLAHAHEQGARGRGGVLEGDARQLPRMLTRARRRGLASPGVPAEKTASEKVARLGWGSVDLILTSPPYGRDIQLIDKPAWIRGGSLGAKDARNYSGDPGNLGHARGESYRAAMAEVYKACAAALKPGGFLAVVTKNLRSGGVKGATIRVAPRGIPGSTRG